MSKYYLDFVGLNTFLYEAVGYHEDFQKELYYWSPTGSVYVDTVEGDTNWTYDGLHELRYINQNYNGVFWRPRRNQRIDVIGSDGAIDTTYQIDAKPEHQWSNISGSSNFGMLAAYKNRNFSHELPNTASFFHALMIRRNGPYGWPGIKAIKGGEKPLIRKQRKNNIFTILKLVVPLTKESSTSIIFLFFIEDSFGFNLSFTPRLLIF